MDQFERDLEQMRQQAAGRTRQLEDIANSLPGRDFFDIPRAPPKKPRTPRSYEGLKTLGYILGYVTVVIGPFGIMMYLGHLDDQKRAQERALSRSISLVDSDSTRSSSSRTTAPSTRYGNAKLDFTGREVQKSNVVRFDIGNCYLESRYDDSNHLYMFRGYNYSFDVDIPAKPSRAELKIRHLSSMANGKQGFTPVRLIVNGEQAAKWSRLSGGYQNDTYQIEDYLRSGRNNIRFSYDSSEGTTGYWQKGLRLDYSY